jgi:hypothetical protein
MFCQELKNSTPDRVGSVLLFNLEGKSADSVGEALIDALIKI